MNQSRPTAQHCYEFGLFQPYMTLSCMISAPSNSNKHIFSQPSAFMKIMPTKKKPVSQQSRSKRSQQHVFIPVYMMYATPQFWNYGSLVHARNNIEVPATCIQNYMIFGESMESMFVLVRTKHIEKGKKHNSFPRAPFQLEKHLQHLTNRVFK